MYEVWTQRVEVWIVREGSSLVTIRAYYSPALFDRERAADYLSVSPRKLDEIQAAGELIPKKHGSKRLYLRKDLEEFADRLPDWEARRN